MNTPTPDHEPQAIRERYARRLADDWRYAPLNPAALAPMQERQRALLTLFRDRGWRDLSSFTLTEVGCGGAGNLLEFLRMGFAPEHLCGIELLAERHQAAARLLPASVRLRLGDAAALLADEAPVDIVYQSTVFSSLLDDAFQQRLADAMWRAVKPGGGVLWYDFTVNNPRNPDVRGVPLQRVRELFPAGRVTARRITLAPPIARAVVPLHPGLYTALRMIPWLRTHLLCWIAKP